MATVVGMQTAAPGGRRLMLLDGLVFRVTDPSPTSAISAETVFEFSEQEGCHRSELLGGGKIVCGRFVGRRSASGALALAYAQLHVGGELRTGTSQLRVDDLADGRVRLIEAFARDERRA